MTLAQPWSLLALALVPLILLLYLLRGIRQYRVVPSVQLWEGEPRQITARARWRRPPLEILLVLQVLFVLLGGLALARPGIDGQPRQDLILVLDASGSMQALDGGGPLAAGIRKTRFDEARRLAQEIFDQAAGAGEVALIRAAATPTILYSGSDVQAFRLALAGASPENAHSDMRAALYMAASLAAHQPDASSQTVVLSDGAYPSVDGVDGLGTVVRAVLIGTSTNNQAVTAVAARQSSATSGKLEGFARVANFDARPVDLPLHASADGTPLEIRQVHLAPRSQVELNFSLPPGTRRFGVALETNDVLPIDDALETTVEAGGTRNVLLVSARTTPLAAALHAVQNVDLTSAAPTAYDAAAANADLVVFDNFLPATLPPRPLILVQPPSGSVQLSIAGELADLEATSLDRTSSVLAGVDTAAVRFSGAGLRDVPAWATATLAAGDIPLVLQGQLDGRRVVVLGFDPGLSHLGQAAALPLLVSNAVNWATSPATGNGVDLGEPARDARAFDVTPLVHAELLTTSGSAPPAVAPRDVWPWVVLLAVAVAAGEWWYWARHG